MKEGEIPREGLRIGIAATVITFSAGFILLPAPNGVPGLLIGLLQISTAISAFFAIMFIIATGATLKYKDQNVVHNYYISRRTRRIFFDWCIDMFGANVLLVVVLAANFLVDRYLPANVHRNLILALMIATSLLLVLLANLVSARRDRTIE
jgi:hypothetical protein